MKTIFITATNTNIGKTYTTLKLIEIYANMGYSVGVMKPIESGVNDTPQDAKKLLDKAKLHNERFKDIKIDEVSPIQLKLAAAPYIANDQKPIDLNILKKSYNHLSKYCDLLLIEGAGGLFTPINIDFFMIDLIEFFNATPILVGDDRLGCISELLVNIKALKSRYKDPIWCINKKGDDGSFEKISLPFFKDFFSKTFILQEDIEELAKKAINSNN